VDLSVTAAWDKKLTMKDGRLETSVSFTVQNKGSAKTSAAQLQVTVKSGVAYKGEPPDGCQAGNGGTITCALGELKGGGKKKLKVSVTLTGTRHRIDGVVTGGAGESATQDNGVALERETTPSPSPSAKSSTRPSSSKSPSAKPSAPKCPAAVIEYSKDGGRTWSRSGLLRGFAPKLKVRVVGPVKKGCQYKVSYASYSAEGATWKTSGKQAFLGMDTVTLTSKKTTAELSIAKHLPPCYGQVDLYGNGKKFDGKKNPLPRYPNAKFPTNMIAGWNGGKACESKPTPSGKPSASASASTSKTPTASVTPSSAAPSSSSPSVTPSSTPSTTPSETPSSTPPATSSESPVITPPPSPSSSSSAAPPPADTTPSRSEPEVVQEEQQPLPAEDTGAPGSLARTGASDRLPYLIAMAVFSILLGALALVWMRRRPTPDGADGNPWLGSRRNPWTKGK
jgi:hypothetical protein